MNSALVRLTVLAALPVVAGLFAGPAASADAAHPVVVELFQSQGCSSCPPADANLNAIAGRPDVLALNFSVTYWDYLGWKDSFADPAFTARQWDYARAGSRGNVSTPQVIVNGRGVLVGNDRSQLDQAIRRFDRGAGEPAITRNGRHLTIGSAGAGAPATVWLVRYDPRQLDVPIRAGENSGRTLPHRNIVRSIQSLGTWKGARLTVALPEGANPMYRAAILMQRGKGGPIIAAAAI